MPTFQQTVKRERRKLGLPDSGCRMATIQPQRYRMQTQQGWVLFVVDSGALKHIGVNFFKEAI